MGQSKDPEADREQRLDEAFAEYLRRVDRGENVDPARFIHGYPDFKQDLEDLLCIAALVANIVRRRLGVDGGDDVDDNAPGVGEPAETVAYVPRGSATETVEYPGATPGDELTGRIFGDHEILELIGRGGMGVVYKARQIGLDRVVALKMIRAGILASQSDLQRFRVEAQAAGKLDHPNIVQVFQVGKIDGQHYFTMEYVEGASLAELVGSGPLESERAARYVKTVAAAVHYAHEHGIIHRDLKPANVIVDACDQPMVTDFGLAKDVAREQGLTDTGTSLGTPSYMSPEQAAARLDAVGAASDIYSLGAILYHLVTGRPPFKAESKLQTILEVIHDEPPPPRSIRQQVDRRLEAITLKCLSKAPDERYRTARELAEDLDRYLAGEPILARPPRAWRKCWCWLRRVPLVAAVIGQRIARPTAAHRIVQWAALGLMLAFVIAITFHNRNPERPFPSQVRFATGIVTGEYHQFGEEFAARLRERLGTPVEVLATEGALENRSLLVEDKAELALVQTSAVASDHLAVATPLYRESVYFAVRADSGIEKIRELASSTVVVGEPGSGMRLSAQRILNRLEIAPRIVEGRFWELSDRAEWDAAIITTGPHNNVLKSLFADGGIRLLSLEAGDVDCLLGPVFRPATIRAGTLVEPSEKSRGIPPEDVQTVSTTTFLVVHRDASSKYVDSVLRALFEEPELARKFNLLSRQEAAGWPALPLHPAAGRFFAEERSEP